MGPDTAAETNDRSRIGHFCNIFFDPYRNVNRNIITDFKITSQIAHCIAFRFILYSTFKKVAALSHLHPFALMVLIIIVVIVLLRQGLFYRIYYHTKSPTPLIRAQRIAFWGF